MIVQCLISVVFMVNGKMDVKQEYLTGIVVENHRYTYHVNFSKEAREKKYIGDYSDTLVMKDYCK